MGDGILALTVSLNGYSESSAVDVDLDSLSPSDIEVLAGLTEIDHDWLSEIAKDGVIPCRLCGDPINDHPRDPPVCQRCLRGDSEHT